MLQFAPGIAVHATIVSLMPRQLAFSNPMHCVLKGTLLRFDGMSLFPRGFLRRSL